MGEIFKLILILSSTVSDEDSYNEEAFFEPGVDIEDGDFLVDDEDDEDYFNDEALEVHEDQEDEP